MRTIERDYRYLLLHLVPRHRLSRGLRRRVDQALHSGDAAAIRRGSVLALEELCASNYFQRIDVRPDDGHVVVGYKRTHGRFRLSVAVPRSEWGDPAPDVAAPEEPTRAEPAPDDHVGRRARDAGAIDFLPDIVRTFTTTERVDPLLHRLEVLLDTLQRWLGLADVRLLVLEDVIPGARSDGGAVEVVAEDTLTENPTVSEAVESGVERLFQRASAPASLRPRDDVEWSTAGISPIYSMGRLRGLFQAYFREGRGEERMREHLDVAATVVRQVIDFHFQIENLTSVDSLTGLYNRHFFDIQLPVEIERAMRSGNVVSMLLLDIDDFKLINDEMGHKAGDRALETVADLIRRNLRKVDLPFRYGGEEIVILLPGTSEFEAVHTAERLRRVIAQDGGVPNGATGTRRVTVSIGVSVYPDTARSSDQLFVQADAAMYRAKQLGKNRVALYQEDMGKAPE